MSFGRNLFMDTAIKKRTIYFKSCYKKVADKATEVVTREFIGNKITNKIAKSKPVPDCYF